MTKILYFVFSFFAILGIFLIKAGNDCFFESYPSDENKKEYVVYEYRGRTSLLDEYFVFIFIEKELGSGKERYIKTAKDLHKNRIGYLISFMDGCIHESLLEKTASICPYY